MAYQYVTIVTRGGTPVRLADQTGAPFPTTGTGPLVFGNGATLTNPIIDSPTYIGPVVIDDDLEIAGDLILDGSSSGATRLRAGATATGTLTLPAATDTLVGRATSDTLTNKSISGFTNTLTNIPNSALTNSSITINGSTVALGGSVTITAAASSITVGTTAITAGTSGRIIYDNAGVVGEYTAQQVVVFSSAAYVVSGLADMKAIAAPYPAAVENKYRATAGDGGGGSWVFRPGDVSYYVGLDPEEGIWAAPDSDPSGASGAWQRQYSGPADARWFGAVADAILLYNTAATPSAITISSTSGSPNLTIGGGIFTAGDIGKSIVVPYIGAANVAVSTTIVGVSGSTTITIAVNAGSTVASRPGPIVYGFDNADALQGALDASLDVLLPDGQYLTCASLQMQPSATFRGQNPERTLLIRAGAFGSTLRGGAPATTAAGGVKISGIHFWEPQQPVSGSTTALPFAPSAGAAHIALYGAQLHEIRDCLFSYMPYAIYMAGCTNGLISNIHHTGYWDPLDAAMQEGIATVGLFTDATFGLCKVNTIENCPALGTGPYAISTAVNYTSTCGTIPETVDRVIGPQHAIYAESSEGLNIISNYLGGSSGEQVYLASDGSQLEVSIIGNFFDGAPYNGYAIRMTTRASTYVYNYKTIIANNTGNGYALSGGFLYADYDGSHISALDLTITGNSVSGYVMAPFRLEGVNGAKFSGNQVRWYNALDVCATDPLYAAGVYVGANCLNISFSGDAFGGGNGYETTDPPNYCSWGIYAAASNLYSAADVIDLGLNTAMFGGSGTDQAANTQVAAIHGHVSFPVAGPAPADMGIWNAAGSVLSMKGGSGGFALNNAANTVTLVAATDAGTLSFYVPLPVASGGTGAATANGAITNLFGGYTGTGDAVRATSPTLTTPNIGAATGTALTINKTTGGGGGPAYGGDMLTLSQADSTTATMSITGFGGTPFITANRANGTYASPTVPVLNSNLLQIAGGGYVSGAVGTLASWATGKVAITFAGNETWSSTANGTRILIGVTPNTTTTRTNTVQISGDIAGGASGLSVRLLNSAQLWLSDAYSAGAPVATGYLTLYDNTGTAYKVLVGT